MTKNQYKKLESIRSVIEDVYQGEVIETEYGFEERNPLPSETMEKLSHALELFEDLMEIGGGK